ncbi:His Kinase A (phospho-acceptor) domain-containing protein [Paenibacillus sp. UNCCL117]|uniref:HAMP domain-containing sensor histidine kinase n=1 Tax=unclassified Paenibacillus TaxID=185978 RepID=UPI00088865D9|nr:MULTISPECIES: HAMP domain-containing sensor histidine kinase [unclassified Paenibacillus]SDC95443.1 His Kinase A (phospho-acceptor) domain-containing protein [Paenibacillus sp. cl123]SFW30046.1 His Kinase A (phospho-acceptor) domain-containing protein [Paenibacillus sp. UNCCL117]
MVKLMNRLPLKRFSLLQSFVLVCMLTLIAVLAVITMEFAWAESLRQRFGELEWVLPSLVAAVLLTVASGIVAMAIIFYRWKLKRPLELLKQASESISANNLDFRISYDSQDEMGELVTAFEHMRSQLEKNVRTLWRSVEERKQLNAIFAHDLRTPLSVLKGNAELLATYLPEKKLSEEKVLDLIHTMNLHIVRLESYAEAMSSIQKLEDIPVHRQSMDAFSLTALLNDSAGQIARQFGKRFVPSMEHDNSAIHVDPYMVMQIFENMVANGARYAASQVNVRYDMEEGSMKITVSDDGPGFSNEALQKAALPFYRGEMWDATEHRGLGLYVCKMLCEKHEGSLQIQNGPNGGGSVTANLGTRVDK